MYRPTLLDYMKVSLEYPSTPIPKNTKKKKIVMVSRFNNSRGCNPCYDPQSILQHSIWDVQVELYYCSCQV